MLTGPAVFTAGSLLALAAYGLLLIGSRARAGDRRGAVFTLGAVAGPRAGRDRAQWPAQRRPGVDRVFQLSDRPAELVELPGEMPGRSLGLVGIAAEIGNAVFHATGRRLRSLPSTIDQLL